MHLGIAIGSTCLGMLVGAQVCLHMARAKKVMLSLLIAAVLTLAGAGVLAVFQLLADPNAQPPKEFWCYPIGLLIGLRGTASIR